MTVTPDGQQRRVDPGPGRDIHLPAPELVSFRTGNRRPAGRGFILPQTDRPDGAHDDSSQAPALRDLTSGLGRSGRCPGNSQELTDARYISFPAGVRHSDGMHLAGQAEGMAALGGSRA